MFHRGDRIVRNGIPVGGRAFERPIKGDGGATFYDEETARMLIFDLRARGWFGFDSKLFNDSRAGKIYVSDHFHETTINAAWDKNKGSDAQAVNFAFDSTVVPGGVKGVTGDAGSGTTADAVAISINNPVQVDPAKTTAFSVGFLIDNVTNSQFFIGFHDTLPSSALEAPFTLATTTYTSTATDGAGILFDTSATSDTLRLVSVANDVDGTPINTGKAFTASTWYDIHLRIDPDGSMNFAVQTDSVQFDLGVSYKLPAGSLRTGVDLYPIVQACARTTTSVNVQLDYIRMHQFAAAA